MQIAETGESSKWNTHSSHAAGAHLLAYVLVLMTACLPLAAQEFAAQINFQTNGPTVPAGYFADTGLVYGPRGNGYTYGWLTDNTANMRDSGVTSVDFRYATYAKLVSNVWEIAVPPGRYTVRVVAGCVDRLDSVNRINVEGVPVVVGIPEGTNFWQEGNANVLVNDGRLTIAEGDGSYNVRMAFLEIRSVGTPMLEIWPETNGQMSLTLVNPSGGPHWLEASSDLFTWQSLATFTNAPAELFAFRDETTTNLQHRFYRGRIPFPLPPQIVYSNAFESPVGSEWSATNLSVTPLGARAFLGRFGTETVRLNLINLPPHSTLTVSFDFFCIQTWDGNSAVGGPDVFDLNVTGGPTLLHGTFRNLKSTGPGQTYPGSYPGAIPATIFSSRTGASEKSTLGYAEFDASYGDSVYHLSYTIPHSTNTVQLNFVGAMASSSIADESWGLDNVVVTVREFR